MYTKIKSEPNDDTDIIVLEESNIKTIMKQEIELMVENETQSCPLNTENTDENFKINEFFSTECKNNQEKPIKTEKTIKRSPNWEQDEKDLLSRLVFQKLDIIEDAKIDTNTNKKKKEAWNALHLLFNEVSTHNRTLEQIQNQWRKSKSLAKTKNSAYIKQTKQTGGSSAPKPLDSVEKESVSRLPKHFEVDTNFCDSNSQINTTNVNINESKTDDELFDTEDDTPIKKPIAFKRKKDMKCQCGFENENAKRIKLLDLSIKQKELEIKCLEENHNMQKRRNEMLEMQEKEEHILRAAKIKIEIENLKKNGFFT